MWYLTLDGGGIGATLNEEEQQQQQQQNNGIKQIVCVRVCKGKNKAYLFPDEKGSMEKGWLLTRKSRENFWNNFHA